MNNLDELIHQKNCREEIAELLASWHKKGIKEEIHRKVLVDAINRNFL